MKLKKSLIFFLGFLVATLAVSPGSFGKEPLKIRVAIGCNLKEISLSVSGPYEIVDARTRVSLKHDRKLSTSKLVVVPDGLKLKDKTFFTDAITVLPKKSATLVVNNRSYRGDISIFKESDGKLLVVNILDLESYVKGVLYHEISHKWPLDAIKAQAVAVRTYAIYQKEMMKLKNYDLKADTSSQVYGGSSSETHKTNRAVNFTYGEILNYSGRVFPTFFHATCGGTTENAGELWRFSKELEPLKGGRLCSFCLESPHYYWKATMDLKTLERKLAGVYKTDEALKNIVVSERNVTGRIRALELKSSGNSSFVISAKDFRQLVGSDVLRSTNFTIGIESGRVTFTGKGWGHGVGLCQWGAFGMSKKGYDYKQILEFYYPGSEIVKIQ